MTEKNYYAELAKINVNEHVEKKGKFSYLSWAYAVDVLKKAHPDATWKVIRHEGVPYIKTELGFFVEVEVTVNGITHSQIHPVLDNNNRPIAQPNSFQINTSIQRALVKAIALHGLGLYIYAGEDLPEDVDSNSAPFQEPSARERAQAVARAKAMAEQPIVDDLPFESNEPAANAIVEPINGQQIKAISNMLNILIKKKPDINKDEFTKEFLAEMFGKSQLEELTFEEGKLVIPRINAKMRE